MCARMMCGNKHHLQLMGRCAREWEGGREGGMRVGRCMAGGWADERVCGQLVGKEEREGGREGREDREQIGLSLHTRTCIHVHTHAEPARVRSAHVHKESRVIFAKYSIYYGVLQYLRL